MAAPAVLLVVWRSWPFLTIAAGSARDAGIALGAMAASTSMVSSARLFPLATALSLGFGIEALPPVNGRPLTAAALSN